MNFLNHVIKLKFVNCKQAYLKIRFKTFVGTLCRVDSTSTSTVSNRLRCARFRWKDENVAKVYTGYKFRLLAVNRINLRLIGGKSISRPQNF